MPILTSRNRDLCVEEEEEESDEELKLASNVKMLCMKDIDPLPSKDYPAKQKIHS